MDRGGLHEKEQPAPSDHPNALARAGTFLASRRPELTLDANLAFGKARRRHDGDIADEGLGARLHPSAAREPQPEEGLADLDDGRRGDDCEPPGAANDEDGQEYGEDEEDRGSFA
jgi:hypothetical protein